MLCYGYTVLYGPPGLVNLSLHLFFALLFGSSTCNALNLDLQLQYMYDSVMQEPKQNSCHQRVVWTVDMFTIGPISITLDVLELSCWRYILIFDINAQLFFPLFS